MKVSGERFSPNPFSRLPKIDEGEEKGAMNDPKILSYDLLFWEGVGSRKKRGTAKSSLFFVAEAASAVYKKSFSRCKV